MRLTLRSMAAVVVAVSMAAGLTGCFPTTAEPTPRPSESEAESEPATGPGLSKESAVELLNAVPGLRSAAIDSQLSGLNTEAVMEVSLDDEAVILAEGVLDYVLRVGWATELPDEPSQLSLSVYKNGTRLDLQAQANELAGFDYRAFPLRYSVHLDVPEYLGAWPGAVPTPPAG